MCTALGYEVTKLRRVRIMNVHLGGLKQGQWRYLTPEEIEGMMRLVADSRQDEAASLKRPEPPAHASKKHPAKPASVGKKAPPSEKKAPVGKELKKPGGKTSSYKDYRSGSRKAR
jgi:23S rRNA pseudouridine2604 synthase